MRAEEINGAGDDSIALDGRKVLVRSGQTVLEVAREAGLDIPTLCFLEKCGPLHSCQVCLVKIDGKLVPSCGTKVRPGMVVESETEEVHEARRTALELLFSDHVGDCLAPCQRLCPLGLNIPLLLRQVQAEATSEAAQTVRQALPLAGVLGHLCHHPCEQGCRRGHWDTPAAIRDIERFVTGPKALSVQESGACFPPEALSARAPYLAAGVLVPQGGGPLAGGGLGDDCCPPCRGATGRKVAVVGAGPAGLAAAYCLAQSGHAVTVLDRNGRPGGTLRSVSEKELPLAVLEREVEVMEQMGIRFRLGVELGVGTTIEELRNEFNAVLVATGESSGKEVEQLGLPMAGGLLKVDPNTMETGVAKVFAAGAAARSVRPLVRVVAEGKAAAGCMHRLLSGETPRRPERAFSSIMGRLQSGELSRFLLQTNAVGRVTPCDSCAGLNRAEASLEGSRCLHCDCRSSGNCLLQHYAQVYNADAGRFRSERRKFEQQVQPGGVIFEPGKCIVCGICVKLTELASEPLGLTFIGRGFDVRIAAPFNHTIEEGLKQTAAECVEHCPTGALAFERKR